MDIAVLAGGRSAEHEVSCHSGAQVMRHLDRSRWRPWPVYLDLDGLWWVPEAPAPPGLDGRHPFDRQGCRALRAGAALDLLIECGIGVVFPALHGRNGEDGTLQGMLELCDLAFVGSDTAASAVCMDKLRTRECLTAHDVPMPRAYLPEHEIARADARAEARRIEREVGYPCFLKIDLSGSTLGVARAEGPADVEAFLARERGRGRRFLAEALAVGEEITVGVLGNSDGPCDALPPVGIYPVRDGYFTFAAKYTASLCEEVVPPRGLDPDRVRAAQDLALRCHSALRCDGMSRTDMIVTQEGPLVLEVNTLPGLTETSLLPKAAAAHGLAFPALLDRLIELALARCAPGRGRAGGG